MDDSLKIVTIGMCKAMCKQWCAAMPDGICTHAQPEDGCKLSAAEIAYGQKEGILPQGHGHDPR